MKNREKGFSLIELLIVVAIILIIAAIAIPNLLQSRQRANETSAVGSLRTVNTSEVTFQSTYGVGYAWDLLRLGPGASPAGDCTNAALIDGVLAGGFKSGYNFAVGTPGTAPVLLPTPVSGLPAGCGAMGFSGYAYTSQAAPNQGKRSFWTDDSGVIRFCVAADPSTPCMATEADLAVQ